ncbi:MAG: hypothetical protein ACRD8Z_27115 [Nitrososphaeraceae archaeon]
MSIVYDVNNMTDEIKVKNERYDIKAVPTTIINDKIKVVGILPFLGYSVTNRIRS